MCTVTGCYSNSLQMAKSKPVKDYVKLCDTGHKERKNYPSIFAPGHYMSDGSFCALITFAFIDLKERRSSSIVVIFLSLPLVTKLTGKTVQMVNIISGPHHHFKGWDQFTAGCAVPRRTKEPVRENTKRRFTHSYRSKHLYPKLPK